MEALFKAVSDVCAKLQIVSDFLWDFPTNLDWYANIPILGSFSIAMIALLGTAIFFTFRFGFVQFRFFKRAVKILFTASKKIEGISPLASFLLSSAMRVGPGNILGVTGAISVGGPGALLWMWISALFSMATAFVESTMAQIFKKKDGDEYIGGMAFYGQKIVKNLAGVGIALSVLYIIYAFLCLPAQGYNTISGCLAIAELFDPNASDPNFGFCWALFLIMIIFVAFLAFGGVKFVTKFTDVSVPIMAVVYIATILILIVVNFDRIPWFFYVVFTEAFQPNAIFGGAFGVALQQGIRRGLMSNEAGQGTITMPAAASNAKHPCEQGLVQSIGVFFDTIVICTPTAFVVIMSQLWLGPNGSEWMELGKLEKFTASCTTLSGGQGIPSEIVFIIMCVCFSLFALTTLVGFVSFTEICAKRISTSKVFVCIIRLFCLLVCSFGIIVNFAGLDLSALWNLSDMANILMVYCNLPLLYIGLKYVSNAYKHYLANNYFYDAMSVCESSAKKIETIKDKNSEKYKKFESRLKNSKNYLKDHIDDDWQFNSKTSNIKLNIWDEISNGQKSELKQIISTK